MISESRLETARLAHHSRSVGEGELLLFLHGIMAGAAVWDPVMTELARDFRCVAIDQRGHGRSDKPSSGYDADHYVADIGAVLEELGPARAVIGHSLGARNAILAAFTLPEQIGAVVAIDYAAGIEPEVFEDLRARRRGGEKVVADRDALRASIRARSPRLSESAVEHRVRHLYEEGHAGFAPLVAPWAVDQTLDAIDVDLSTALRDSRVPTLLVRGGESPFLSQSAFAASLRLRDDLRGATVADTDHFVNEEAPGEVADLIRSFVTAESPAARHRAMEPRLVNAEQVE